MPPLKTLTIGGIDPCGAYGLVTDLKVFAGLGAHGMGAVTVVTAQNSVGWYGAEPMPALFVAQQLEAVFTDYGVDGVKTGFLGRVEIIRMVVEKMGGYGVRRLVVDPVLVNQHGRAMFPPEVTAVYQTDLLPLATIITPNPDELRLLCAGVDPTPATAQALAQRVNTAVLLTGLPHADQMQDWLLQPNQPPQMWAHPALDTPNTAGSGDTLSAALTVYLAQGLPLPTAVAQAIAITQHALQLGAEYRLAHGRGPLALWQL
jgi:hydroxymethylpyrimidine/phosphomethylpyrimidine kinase